MIDGVAIREIQTHADDRGYFREIFRATDAVFDGVFGQCSHSLVRAGVLKAWHGHHVQTQWTYVAAGTLAVAIHDPRPGSRTFGRTEELLLGDGAASAVYRLPPGVVHGYRCLSGPAQVFYMTSGTYDPAEELRLSPDDPSIGYDWSAR